MKSLNLNGTAAQHAAIKDKKYKNEVAVDDRLQQLMEAKPEQVDVWVDQNVTDLTGVILVLKFILRIVLVLARREFR